MSTRYLCLCLLATLLLSGCDWGMTPDQVTDAALQCKAAGLGATYRTWCFGDCIRVLCVPKSPYYQKFPERR